MSNVEKLRKRATDFEQKRQIDKAIATYLELFKLWDVDDRDRDVALYNRTGDLLIKEGNVGDAMSVWEKAVDYYADGGFHNNAIALCNKILRHSPGRTSVYYKLGKISAQKGFKGDAKKNFLEYADRMQKADKMDEAFRALKEFADLCPDEDDIRQMLADQLAKIGRNDEAIEQLQVLYERYESTGDSTAAAAAAERIKAIDPTVEPKRSGPRRSRESSGLVFIDLDGPSASSSRPSRKSVAAPPMKTPIGGVTAQQRKSAVAGLPMIDVDDPPKVVPIAGLETTAAAPPPEPPPVVADVTFGASFGTEEASVDTGAQLMDLQPTSFDAGQLGEGAVSSALSAPEDASFGTLDVEGFGSAFETDVETADAGSGIEIEPSPGSESGGPPPPVPDEARLSMPLLEMMEPIAADGLEFITPSATPAVGHPVVTPSVAHPAVVSDTPAVESAADDVADSFSAADAQVADAVDAVAEATDLVDEFAGAKVEDAATVFGEPSVEPGVDAAAETPVEPSIEAHVEASVDSFENAASAPVEVIVDEPVDAIVDALVDVPATELVELPADAPTGFDTGAALDEVDASLDALDAFDAVDAVDVTTATPASVEQQEPVTEDVAASTPAGVDALVDDAGVPRRTTHRSTMSVMAASVDMLRERIAHEPTNWQLHQEFGEALLEDGDRAGGLEHLENAMGGFERADNLESARSVADEIIRLNPHSVRHHQKRVEFAFRMSDRPRLIEAYVELADALFRAGQAEKAKAVYQRVLDIAPDDIRAQAALTAFVEEAPPEPTPPEPRGSQTRARRYTSETPIEPTRVTPPPMAKPKAAEPEGDFVDLEDWLKEDEGPKSTRMVVEEKEPTGDEDADFNDMLRKFKQGVAQNVEEEDHESHYDLGIAYKEMGLIEEAIAEFQKALRGTSQRVRTYEALGQCFVEKKQESVAMTILQRALAEPGVGDDQLVGVLYLLGNSAEVLKMPADAVKYYQRVFAVDINFRDVQKRMRDIEQAAR